MTSQNQNHIMSEPNMIQAAAPVKVEAPAGDGKPSRKRHAHAKGRGTLALRGNIYQARWVVDGKVYVRSTKTNKKKEAERLLEQWTEDFYKKSEVEIVERLAARVRGVKAEAEAHEAAERDRRAILIAGAFPIYEESKRRPDSGARTLAGYEAQYTIFEKWCAEHYPDKPRLCDFTPDMAEAFIRHIEKTRSRNTRNKYLIFLRTFWRVMRWNADALLTIDPWDGIRTLTAAPDTVERRDLTVEELGRIAAYLRTNAASPVVGYLKQQEDGAKVFWDLRGEMLSLVALGVYLGARLGDCVTLEWGAVDLALGTVTYKPRKTARKYKREVTAPLHPALAHILAAVPVARRVGYLLPMLAYIYGREPSMLTNRFQAVLREVGIETKKDAPDGEGGGTRARVAVGFHSLRHFFAAWLDNHGVNHSLTNYLTCHEQGKVEAGYYHGNREALAAAVSTLPVIPMLADDEPPAAGALSFAPAAAPDPLMISFREIVGRMNAAQLHEAKSYMEGITK